MAVECRQDQPKHRHICGVPVGTGTAEQRDRQTAGLQGGGAHVLPLCWMGPWAAVSGASAPQSKQRMRRANRGGGSLPNSPSYAPLFWGFGRKKTGRSLGRWWARVEVGELETTRGGRRKEDIRFLG